MVASIIVALDPYCTDQTGFQLVFGNTYSAIVFSLTV